MTHPARVPDRGKDRAPADPPRRRAFRGALLAACLLGPSALLLGRAELSAGAPRSSGAVAHALGVRLAASGATPAVARFYRARLDAPLWIDGTEPRPAAARLIALLRGAGADGLDPARYHPEALAGLLDGPHDPARLAALDLALSQALATYVHDLHTPARSAQMDYVSAGLVRPVSDPGAVLAAASSAPSLDAYLASLRQVNPIYDALRSGLADYRAHWAGLPPLRIAATPRLVPGGQGPEVARLRQRLGLLLGSDHFDEAVAARLRAFQKLHALDQTGRADAETLDALNRTPQEEERAILINMDRARAFPHDLGQRFIYVDVPAQELVMIDHERPVGGMRVIVGKPSEPTPILAGKVQYVVLHPYWNLPPDLIAERARKVLKDGPGILSLQHIQLLSGWTPDARVIRPSQVNWAGVASGKIELRARQVPGPFNMMGQIKFMFPNQYGVYLHDTANHAPFALPHRLFSAGCVRLSDPAALERWLFGGRPPRATGEPAQRVDLPRPVPVYIAYLTVMPARGGLRFHTDVYGRDRSVAAELAQAGGTSI